MPIIVLLQHKQYTLIIVGSVFDGMQLFSLYIESIIMARWDI